jgi:hypothetical protein
VRALAVGEALDLEQCIDPPHDRDHDRGEWDFPFAGGLATRVLLDVGHARFLHQQASEFMPRRISVWPAAIHARTTEETGIIAVAPTKAQQPQRSASLGCAGNPHPRSACKLDLDRSDTGTASRAIGAILLDQNDEWAVQRAHYMTLETIAPLRDDPKVSLVAITS